MAPEDVKEYVLSTYKGVVFKPFWGDLSFFYNPQNRFSNGTYFATLKLQDGENDRASQISRDGVWRLNLGLTPKTYRDVLGQQPSRPPKGEPVEGPWNFTELDRLMPHPCYGWMSWVAILSPSHASFETLKPLFDDAYGKAVKAFEKRVRAEQKVGLPEL